MTAKKLRFSQEELEQLEDLASAGYSLEKCALYFGVAKADFMAEYFEVESFVHYHYQRGILKTEAEGAIQLTKKESKGNLTAIQQLDKIRRRQFVENEKRRILYGEETPRL